MKEWIKFYRVQIKWYFRGIIKWWNMRFKKQKPRIHTKTYEVKKQGTTRAIRRENRRKYLKSKYRSPSGGFTKAPSH